MKWPWVSRARHEAAERLFNQRIVRAHDDYYRLIGESSEREERMALLIGKQEARYETLLEKYHALRMQGAVPAPPVPAPVDVEQPDVPPTQVLEAMRRISPIKDKTFDANYAFWERNKDRAQAHPDAFADEILAGLDYSPSTA